MSDYFLDRALARLGSAAEVVRRSSLSYRYSTGRGRKLVIAGAGHLGQLALRGARRAGLDVVAFADNSPRLAGRSVDGVPVLTPETAFERHGRDAFVVVAIYNPTPLREQLRRLGFNRLVAYPVFFWEHADSMPEETRLERPARILDAIEGMKAGYERLADPQSRMEFAAQIEWRCSADYSRLRAPDPSDQMYFAPDLVRISADEVFVDCGAFDGDTIRTFREKTSGAFRQIYAIEPDPASRECLRQYLGTWSDTERNRVSIMPYGVGAFNGPVAFTADGTVGSHVAEGIGQDQIECRTLDELLPVEPVSLIKMDIEGAEPDALRGAAALIQRVRPTIAACAYHACDHLWRLPEILSQIAPDYRIYLRRYAEECWETVYYAIPSERAPE